ncbi:Inherit from bactNOG: hydrolase [Seminavis robusta]|uniref:Inherit from bactNOG: hydrolase n=1 Tax=Seminavis robusta TaxID=568900 RepID=A0A9N8EHU9_9STRA|nr:Inherit from bactNOG: hydrolase [Seminavis robusta]|eukprot:Sro1190_g250820.1 Inherit from bactNOG: hydrolase (95) ;mRNA; r:22187-22471
MSGTYAHELAARAMVTLAFDLTGWGESSASTEARKRFIVDPTVKTADIQSAAKCMLGRDDVDKTKLSGFGICASSGYVTAAVVDNASLQERLLA